MKPLQSLITTAMLTGAVFAAQAQTRWDLPAAYPATNFHSENLVAFANDVDRATGGKLKITVHPNASLFKAPEIKRAVQGGQAQIGEVLISNFSNEWPLFGADALPFLADSYDDNVKLWKAQKPFFDKKLAEQGLIALYSVPWPPQGIYSKKPLNSAADLKGMKWRAYNPYTSRIAELVGAQPVTVQAAEVSQAFATGVAESMMSSGSTGWDAKLHEHVKYWYDTQAWLPRNLILVNKAAFDALDAATKQAVLKAAADAEVRGLAASKKANGDSLDKLRAGGMQILQPSAQLKTDMKKVGETLLKEWIDKAGPEGKAMVDAYREVMRRALDALYDGAAALAALFMIGLLAMVLLAIVSRIAHFHVPGTDAYAGYCMAAAGFLALAHTLKRGEHIRVTLLVNSLTGRARHRLELWALGAATALAGLAAYYACRLAWQSRQFNDISTGNDATPLWIPQLAMAAGSVILLVAFVDEFVLEWRGLRGGAAPAEALHNE